MATSAMAPARGRLLGPADVVNGGGVRRGGEAGGGVAAAGACFGVGAGVWLRLRCRGRRGGRCCRGRCGGLGSAAEEARLLRRLLGRVLEGMGQLSCELARRPRALLRLGSHAALQHARGLLRRRGPHVEQVGRTLGGDPVRDLQRRAALSRALAAERLVADRGERVDVGGRAGSATVELLGGHVRDRAEHGAAARDLGPVGRGRDAEVSELRDAVLADQHVPGLHIAVDDPLRVGVVERLAEVAHHGGHLLRPKRAAAQHPRQRLALHVLHDDQHALVVGGGVEHRDQVRVVERSAELRLAGEALLHVDRAVGMQALDGNLPSEAFVLT